MRRWLPVAAAVAVASACSLGDGVGTLTGQLNIPDCWVGDFDLQPNFFAAVPYPQQPYAGQPQSLTLRIQNGGGFESVSDGVVILVDSIDMVRGGNGFPGELGQPLQVSLPPNVTPPGVPVMAVSNPAIVHMTLYLQRTCHTQLDALYAVDAVALGAGGGCADAAEGGPPLPVQCGATGIGTAPPSDGGVPADATFGTDAAPPPPPPPDAGVADGATDGGPATAPPPYTGSVGHSSITFTHLFDGVLDESDSQQRLNEGSFDVYLADPREICPGGFGPPPRCRAHLTGNFKFYFERGRPAQPFP